MLKVENRESAHLRSSIKDLSVVPNVVSFNGLFAAITPIAKVSKNAEGLYEPILIRDADTLVTNFGDPRINPEKYIDLYTIMQLVKSGGTCYVAKVNSGNSGVYQFSFVSDKVRQDDTTGKDVTLPLEQVKDDVNTYHLVTPVKNKYSVTSVKGYKKDGGTTTEFTFYSEPFTVIGEKGDVEISTAEVTEVPDGEEVDYTGRYTWECVSLTDGTFDLVIKFSEEIQAEVTSLVVSGTVDSSWGSEPLVFAPVESTIKSPNPVHDEENKISTIVFESIDECGDITNEYIINEFIDELPAPLSNAGVIYDTILVKKKLNLTFTVPYKADGTSEDFTGITEDTQLKVKQSTRKSHAIIGYSSMSEALTFNVTLSQVKPYSIHAYYLNLEVLSNNGTNSLGSVKIKLESTTTNQGIVNAFNSALGTVIRFELMDPSTASACGVKEKGANSIAQAILDAYCEGGTKQKITPNPIVLNKPITIESPTFQIDVNDYIDALTQYKAKKYVGCLMADMVCPVTDDIDPDTNKPTPHKDVAEGSTYPLNAIDRRNLHYKMKDIAYERKDTTVILSTPYTPGYDNLTVFTIDDACDWVASQGAYTDLWEYGQGSTTDYATQSFYLEMYYSWLSMRCDYISNGIAGYMNNVKVAPANLVVNNILTSWRNRGVHYPVAGDQGGVLPNSCTILMNPKTKLERDQLVQYRINPIWDTGTRGIQIFGNETLNAGYTDLNAAHIARTLIYIRSKIDEYTEKLKFSINNLLLWDKWKTYVTQYILEPLISVNAISEYRVAMGEDTTSKEEIANRTINGEIELIFYQSAEIFNLTYVIYSSATTIEEASGRE